MNYLFTRIIALLLGIILDFIIGDPYKMPHPIRLIGRLIAVLDEACMGDKNNKSINPKREKLLGLLIVVIVVIMTFSVTGLILLLAYKINYYTGIALEAVLIFYTLAAKSLCSESMKVYKNLSENDLEKARYSVSMIVGRDTNKLDEIAVTKAAVETVAENTSDGVIAPVIYNIMAGPVLGMTYKAINTMDSMIGYHNERYEHLGYVAAKLDDFVNYLPSRISAVFMILASFILHPFINTNGVNAYKIWKRDRRNHKSPNSAQTESVTAGSLGIRLAGDASYFGKIVKKPYIGDEIRRIEYNDIKKANALMFVTELMTVIIGIGIMMLIMFLII